MFLIPQTHWHFSLSNKTFVENRYLFKEAPVNFKTAESLEEQLPMAEEQGEVLEGQADELKDRFRAVFSQEVQANKEALVPTAIEMILEAQIKPFDHANVALIRDWFRGQLPEIQENLLRELKKLIETRRIKFNIFTLCLLGELFRYGRTSFVNVKFHNAFENIKNRTKNLGPEASSDIFQALKQMEKSANEDRSMQYRLHLALDMIIDFFVSVQNEAHMPPVLGNPYYQFGLGGYSFFIELGEIAKARRSINRLYMGNSADRRAGPNYLIDKKYQDLFDIYLSDGLNLHKPDAISGIAGGNADSTIFRFRNLVNSYNLRLKYNFFEGYMTMNPLMPIAPGYVALYGQNDEIMKIYEVDEEGANNDLSQDIEKNSAVPEGAIDIYEILNREQEIHYDVDRINRLEDIRRFRDSLGEDSSFVFNLNKINLGILHPVVVNEIVNFNKEALEKKFGNNSPHLKEIGKDAFFEKVYPDRQCNAMDEYEYLNLSSVSIRKKIQDDFGINIADYDLWIQRMFLEYLNGKTIFDFKKLKKFLSEGNQRNRFIALTATHNDPEFEGTLFSVAEQEGGDIVFKEYADIVETAEEVTDEIYAIYKEAIPTGEIARQEIFGRLLKKAKSLIKTTYKDIKKKEKPVEDIIRDFRTKVLHEDRNIRLTRDLVTFLSREDVRSLDLEKIKTVDLIGPIKSAEFANNSEYEHLRQQVFVSIEAQFPAGDREVFEKEFLKNLTAELYIATCGGELLTFFGSSKLSPDSNIRYLDWFIANPTPPVKGLGEAMVTTMTSKIKNEDCYLIAKPYVKSFLIAIERMGFVSFGQTEKNEYKNYYLRCRNILTEGEYRSKNLARNTIKNIQLTCEEKEKVYDYNHEGTPLKACIVKFSNLTFLDNIDERDPQVTIFRIMRELENEKFVLTRYIPQKNTEKGVEEYLCVFEKNCLGIEGEKRLAKGVEDRKTGHAHPESLTSAA